MHQATPAEYLQHLRLALALVPPSHPGRAQPATDAEVAALESDLGIALPGCVREFLGLANGMGPQAGSLLGGSSSPFGSIQNYSDWNPAYLRSRLLPVGTDGCGNLYVLSMENGRVHFHDVAESADAMTYEAASSGWLFYLQMIVTECNPHALLHDRDLLRQWDPGRASRSG